MRIGMVTPSWPGTGVANGITTTVVNLVDGLTALGHDVTLISLAPDPVDDPRCLTLPPSRAENLRERLTTRFDLGDPTHHRFAQRIGHAARLAIDRDGIDALVMEETQGWAAIVQDMVPIPVIVTLHGPWFIQTELQNTDVTKQDKRRLRREAHAFRQCAAIIAPSQHVLDKTIAAVPDVSAMRCVLHNPIHQKTAVDYQALSDKQRRSILFVGRNDRRKGADVLLQAFATLIREGSDTCLTFVGPDAGLSQPDGPDRFFAEVISQFPQEVQKRVSFLGPRTKNEIDQLRKTHGLTVIASRYETFGYVVLEAMAAGAATISTNAGGPSEIIKDGKTGLLIPANDAKALSAAMKQVLDDPALAARLGAAARDDIAERFSPTVIAARLVAFTEGVVSNHVSKG